METTIGQKLKELRAKKKFTQEMIAERLGVTNQTISQYEKDSVQPSIDRLLQFCEIYGVQISYFISDFKQPVDTTKQESELIEELRSTMDFLKTQVNILNEEKKRLYDVIDRLTTSNFPAGSSLTVAPDNEGETTTLKLVA